MKPLDPAQQHHSLAQTFPRALNLGASGLALAFVVLLVAYKALHLSAHPLSVPFTYHEGDSVVMLMYIKALVQDGWPLTMTHLSAPFSYPGAAFPMQTSTDWLVIKAMSLFTQNPGLLINMFWLWTAVMSAWATAYAAYQMRLSALLACAAGVLYAFLPFALMRFTHHLNLVYYLVPLHCLLAVMIAAGPQVLRAPNQARIIGLLACVLQGFDYVYYSFFAVLLFSMAALVGARDWRALRLPLLAIVLVGSATVINLAPSLYSWNRDGRPPEMGYKSVAESEIFGAKLRAMVLPHTQNAVRPLAKLAIKNQASGFPLDNENQTARLGLFGAFGLLLILALRVRNVRTTSPVLDALSALGLGTFLVITVGGLGALINVLSVPDIRAYNRFSVFLSFFAIAAAALWLEARLPAGRRARMAGYAAILLFALFSLRDQLYDVRGFRLNQQNNIARVSAERAIVGKLEQLLPKGAMVLQLPLTGYPPIEHIGGVESYDHGRYSLWSRDLRWSWPSFSQRHRAWQTKLSALKGQALLDAAILSGFDAIWIDRRAHKDRSEALLASLARAGVTPLDVGGGDIAVLDIRAASAELKQSLGQAEFARQAKILLSAGALADFKRGFYHEERSPEGKRFRWAENEAKLDLKNVDDQAISVCVSFQLAIANGGKLRIEGGGVKREISADTRARTVQFPLTLAARDRATLRLATDAARLGAPNDPRKLHFYVMEFAARTLAPAEVASCTIE